jgi:CHAD domain-containing protein
MPPRLLAEHLASVQRQEASLPAPEAVHQMRVATRRLRTVLRVLHLRALEPEAKRLQDALGKVRDLQLQVQWLDGRDAALLRSQKARLRRAVAALERAVRRWREKALPPLLDAAAGCPSPSQRKVSKDLRKGVRRLRDTLEEARAAPTPTAIHAARISAKKVRYLVEVARDALPRRVVRLEHDLKSLHASLGELHDLDVRIALVRRKPALLREQQEERARLGKIASAQLERWHKQHVLDRVSAALH